MKIKKIITALALLPVTACVTVDQTWVREYEGNQLSISSGKIGSDERYISVTNNERNWEGNLRGGKDKVPTRKSYLLEMGKQEARVVCKGANELPIDKEPDYIMLDRSPMLFGGGLLGYALAAGMSDYDNLPTGMTYRFKCSNEPASSTSITSTSDSNKVEQNSDLNKKPVEAKSDDKKPVSEKPTEEKASDEKPVIKLITTEEKNEKK